MFCFHLNLGPPQKNGKLGNFDQYVFTVTDYSPQSIIFKGEVSVPYRCLSCTPVYFYTTLFSFHQYQLQINQIWILRYGWIVFLNISRLATWSSSSNLLFCKVSVIAHHCRNKKLLCILTKMIKFGRSFYRTTYSF